jgi:hypothetical protein
VIAASFPLGDLVATPGALEALARTEEDSLTFLTRHATGDWGELDGDDRRENDRSVEDGRRVLSAYRLRDGVKIWVITEGDRSATTILLPEEY